MARAKTAPLEQLPLFGPPPVEPVGRLQALPAGAGARWSRFKSPVRQQCADCVVYLHENAGVGPAVRSARWRRIDSKGDLLLCPEHAQYRRRIEGLASLEEKKPKRGRGR